MKKILFFLFFLIPIVSCKEEDKFFLYKVNNKTTIEEKELYLAPLLSNNDFDKLIKLKASFPLISYSPTCENSCSLFPLYYNSYIKENSSFFPIIYASNHVDSKSDQSQIFIYKEGIVLKKDNIDIFNNTTIKDYLNKYTYQKDIYIANDLLFSRKEAEYNLATFISYKENVEYSFLSSDEIKKEKVLIINDNILDYFDETYFANIEKFKYIYFMSKLNDNFYLDFNLEKKDYLYSVLSYEDKYLLNEYLP